MKRAGINVDPREAVPLIDDDGGAEAKETASTDVCHVISKV